MRERFETIQQNLIDDIYLEPLAHSIEEALIRLASAPCVNALTPHTSQWLEALNRAPASSSGREEAAIELYLRLHGAGTSYEDREAGRMRQVRGIGNLPGGLTPILMACELVGPDTVMADLGAGCGLQGLLLQYLAPHALTIQVELSAAMIEAGRVMSRTLGIADEKLRWVHGDIATAPFEAEADLVYLYRPIKPYGEGRQLYRDIARRIDGSSRVRHIISMADCLGPHLKTFDTLYQNEYLTIFNRTVWTA